MKEKAKTGKIGDFAGDKSVVALHSIKKNAGIKCAATELFNKIKKVDFFITNVYNAS